MRYIVPMSPGNKTTHKTGFPDSLTSVVMGRLSLMSPITLSNKYLWYTFNGLGTEYRAMNKRGIVSLSLSLRSKQRMGYQSSPYQSPKSFPYLKILPRVTNHLLCVRDYRMHKDLVSPHIHNHHRRFLLSYR